MKKLIALMLAALMVLSLAACQQAPTPTDPPAPTDGPTDPPAVQDPTDPPETDPPETDPPVTETPVKGFSYTLNGLELTPGMAFDPAKLPTPDSVYEVPSCADQGTDTIYTYGGVELTIHDDGAGDKIYSIYIFDANTPSAEGLYIGDGMEQVHTLYGTDYTQEGSQITYRRGVTLLVLIVENDSVMSIDYRWDFSK